VIAQVLEYAAHIRGWSYGDLTARLKTKERWAGENPIFARAKERWPDLDEVLFVDALSRSLAVGDFQLVVAGDGIRGDVHAIVWHLNAAGGFSRLSLLEIQLWMDQTGRTLVVPNLALRTETIEQRVLLASDGAPVRLQETASGSGPSAGFGAGLESDQSAQRHDNRAFWQAFIGRVRFDHPNQTPPRHGGNNWVRLDLPSPAGWLTVYRMADRIGLFIPLEGEEGCRLL
jgi:hypothetical protein